MWWMIAAIPVAGLIGLEARRVMRVRRDERTGPRTYALYAEGQPDTALRLIDIPADAGDSPADPAGCAGGREKVGWNVRRLSSSGVGSAVAVSPIAALN